MCESIGEWFLDLVQKSYENTVAIGNWFIELGDKIGEWFTNLVQKSYENTVAIGNWFSELRKNVGEKIGEASTNTIEKITTFKENVTESFTNTISNISSLPKGIWDFFKDGLLWLFVPEENYFNERVEEVKTAINQKIPYQNYIDSLKDLESITDMTGDTDEITVGIDLNNYSILDKFTLSMNNFIDFSIFSEYKHIWYSWVRVVVYIGLVIYNINQTVKMFNGFGAVDGAIREVQSNVNRGNDKK